MDLFLDVASLDWRQPQAKLLFLLRFKCAIPNFVNFVYSFPQTTIWIQILLIRHRTLFRPSDRKGTIAALKVIERFGRFVRSATQKDPIENSLVACNDDIASLCISASFLQSSKELEPSCRHSYLVTMGLDSPCLKSWII